MRTPTERRSLVLGLALMLALSLLVLAPPGPAAEASPRAGTPADELRWSPCYREVGPGFECALVPVPLDHARPNGPTIQLALVRLAATAPDQRIGSLFFNPGGPGGSGVDFILQQTPLLEATLGPDVRASFDLVGLDPRGIARSTSVRCFGTTNQLAQALPPVAFPLDAAEEDLFRASDAVFAERCPRGNRILPHMSTANVALDLDLLRQRAGDEHLHFVGYSYGSYLGVVYANLFPERVGAMVLDGVLDPVAWRNAEGEVPFTTRIGSAGGAQDTLVRFLELCEQAPEGSCLLAPGAEERFDAVAADLLEQPLVLSDPVTGEELVLTYQDLIATTLNLLYSPAAFPLLAQLVWEIEVLSGPALPASLSAVLQQIDEIAALPNRRGHPNYVNMVEGFSGVSCADSSNPTDYAAWAQAGAQADEESYFGRLWTWQGSQCAQWPVTDTARYDGGFSADTANPVLVASPLYDPATPVEGAAATRALLPSSALLTVDMPGHTTLVTGNACAGASIAAYLLDPAGTAPVLDGSTCPMEVSPFEMGVPPTATPVTLAP